MQIQSDLQPLQKEFNSFIKELEEDYFINDDSDLIDWQKKMNKKFGENLEVFTKNGRKSRRLSKIISLNYLDKIHSRFRQKPSKVCDPYS